MPAREIQTNLTLTGEKEFASQMGAVNSNLKTLKAEQAAVASSFDKGESSMAKNLAMAKNLKEQNAQQAEVIRAATVALKQNEQAYGADSKQADKFRTIIANAQTAINKNNKELQKYSVAAKAGHAAQQALSVSASAAKKGIEGIGHVAAGAASGIGKLSGIAVGAATAVVAAAGAGLGLMTSYAKEAAAAAQAAADAGEPLSETQQQWLAFSDQLGELDKAASGAKEALGAILMPVLGDLANTGADFLNSFTEDMEAAAGDTESQGRIMAEYVGKGAQLIKEKLPEYLQTGKTLLTGLMEGLVEVGPDLLETGIDLIMDLLDGILEMAPQMIDMGIELVGKLMDGLIQRGPDLITSAVNMVTQLITGLAQAAPDLIPKAFELVTTLVGALIQAAPDLIVAGLELVWGVVQGLGSGIGDMISSAGDLLDGLISGFTDAWPRIQEIGGNIVKGIWEGIDDARQWLMDKIGEWVGNIIDWIKDKLGIHSPSAIMRDQVGVMMARGLAVGFENEMDKVNREIAESINTNFAPPALTVVGAGRRGTAGAAGGKSVTLNFYANQISEGDIALVINRINEEWGAAI